MRSQISARGAKTICRLGRVSRNFDSFEANKKIEAQEFISGLREIQVQVTQTEADKLMSILDTNGYGHINGTEFVVAIRGTLDEKRKAMVDKPFLKFDAY